MEARDGRVRDRGDDEGTREGKEDRGRGENDVLGGDEQVTKVTGKL